MVFSLVFALLSALLSARCGLAIVAGMPLQMDFASSFGQPGNATFDYVVVGGGTAGLAIASRLATKHSVAVIEAGGFYQIQNGNGSVIPAMAPLQAAGTSPNVTLPLVDWGIVTTPQAGANGRRLHYARGKTLGGSSARNYLFYHRGTVGSYQRWADTVGDSSYTFANFLPYFKKSCSITPPDMSKRQSNGSVTYSAAAFNNSLGGPLHVTWPNWADPLSTWALEAMAVNGMPLNPLNFNSGILNGSAWMPVTQNPSNSFRDSSQTSFLAQAMQGTDILVYTEALAKRILFDSDKKATGVLVNQAGASFVLSASKEVILSAGAFQSPQLLMVSGIGPAAALREHGIPIIANLSGVGQNLQDQPLFGVAHRVNVITSSDQVNNPSHAALDAQLFRNNSGPLTSTSAAVSFDKITGAARAHLSPATRAALDTLPADWPEVEYAAVSGFQGTNADYAVADPHDGYNYGTMDAILVAPLSRGSVGISSADASVSPVVDPAWLTHPADQEVAVAAFRRLRALWAAMPNVTLGSQEYFPGPSVQTDAQVLNFVRNILTPVWHASSTCSMGKAGDPMAVVDSHARVLGGVCALRVVDASAFPFLPPGHPQSTVYALAEKIADDILNGN